MTLLEKVNFSLIRACKCKGSISHIHVECLKEWIKAKRTVKEDSENINWVVWKNLNCELCKTPFAQECEVKIDG